MTRVERVKMHKYKGHLSLFTLLNWRVGTHMFVTLFINDILFVCLNNYLITNCLIFKHMIYIYTNICIGNVWTESTETIDSMWLESGNGGVGEGARFTFHYCTIPLLHNFNCSAWNYTMHKCHSQNIFSNNLTNMG